VYKHTELQNKVHGIMITLQFIFAIRAKLHIAVLVCYLEIELKFSLSIN